MRRNVLLTSILSLFMTTLAFAHYPGTVKVDVAAKKQPPVTFNHARHGDTLVKSCDTCHHMNKGLTRAQADKVDVKKCSTCHLEAKGKTPSMREMSLTRNPMHIRCVGCHKDNKKGPTACTGCHKKA